MGRDRLARIGALGSLFLIVGLIATVFAPATAAQEWSPPAKVWVEETGHTVDGLFLSEWRSYQELLGQPITEEFTTKLSLGDEKKSTYAVQYFENQAIAYVPEDTRDGWDVQAVPLGKDALKTDEAKLAKLTLPSKGNCAGLGEEQCTTFSENGHTMRLGFNDFWRANDGERLLGSPLTEEFVGADGVTTQYFENAVLRWTQETDVTVRPIGKETAKRLKMQTAKIAQPVDIPVYDEALFVAPVVETGVGGYDLGDGPGPQQGAYKEIVVSISAQSMWAYENGELVISSLISTGVGNVPETETPLGYFSVVVKFEQETMEGTIAGEYYKLVDVPNVMYFDGIGNALHGTYWHNNFGTPMSHGCVNLPMDVADWMYQWAPMGMTVEIVP